ncbi:hypothetical protein [Pseudomonas sp. 273]|uniref:hypothetical protein n=1 Tax=Pseudomonas sp. 273 TaxID=75692 RepID=UPI0023D81BBB|nr:hypothetical protein [Pseudomonas sp. 273]
MSTTHPTEALYTLCPLPIASNIAVELGWLDEEFQRVGARARYLRSLPDNQGWLPHFRHSRDDLIRDGGAVPALWARADLSDTLLVASTASQRPGQILVRAGAGIRRVAQLAGCKVGVPRSANRERIDVLNALAEQTLHYSLELAGLDREQVQVVEFEDHGDPRELQPAQRPAALWAQLREHHQAAVAVQALADGAIDALVVQAWQAPGLLQDGRFTVIEDLDRYPDWTLKNVNGPMPPWSAAVSPKNIPKWWWPSSARRSAPGAGSTPTRRRPPNSCRASASCAAQPRPGSGWPAWTWSRNWVSATSPPWN